MFASNGHLCFDGKVVFCDFLKGAFHFSLDLQSSLPQKQTRKETDNNTEKGVVNQHGLKKDLITTFQERLANAFSDRNAR